ncbi:hypothetical protein [Kineococcus sp. SYSU DK003]|uniref:hypothetical protein n=1 Tax=Kineococcus sp. SYSU DK003 TaxID=3383124 RepID=UPI003D7CC637
MEQQQPTSDHDVEEAADGFYSPVRRPPVFDPAGAYRRSIAGQAMTPEEARKHRRRRRRTIDRVVGAGLLITLGAGGWFGYRPVWAKTKTSVRDAMVQEMKDVASAEQNYRSLYGSYTTDRTQLALADDGFNDVRIVSTAARTFCLSGDPLVGQKLYYSPDGGFSEVPCV